MLNQILLEVNYKYANFIQHLILEIFTKKNNLGWFYIKHFWKTPRYKQLYFLSDKLYVLGSSASAWFLFSHPGGKHHQQKCIYHKKVPARSQNEEISRLASMLWISLFLSILLILNGGIFKCLESHLKLCKSNLRFNSVFKFYFWFFICHTNFRMPYDGRGPDIKRRRFDDDNLRG